MSERVERALLAVILAVFTLLGALYSVVVPPFEASDEKWHYPMVKYIADYWALPVQEPGVETPWRQEGSQAPLYYALAAAATCWIDTSDMDAVRRLNPHADAGATPDGNVNLAVHDPALERFPWQGTVLAVHLVRFLSVLMGTAAVYLTYRIAREVVPDRPALALGAAAAHAFTPMYVFISGSVNNDNLAVLLGSLGLWLLVRLSGRWQGASGKWQVASGKWQVAGGRWQVAGGRWQVAGGRWQVAGPIRAYLLLGVVLGLAALTKSQTLALAPIAALVIAVRAARRRPQGWKTVLVEIVVGGLATALPLLLIAGWWYLRNLQLYGDLTGLNVFKEILGTRDVPADLPQLWRERFSFLNGYWGNFGGINVPMAQWAYDILNAVLVVAGVGLVIALVRRRVASSRWQVVSRNATGSTCHLPLATCLLWALAVFVPWLWWAMDTWSSQGRLVFYAIPVWSFLLVLGLAGWLPRRWEHWAAAALAAFLLVLAALAPWLWIAPAYAPPQPLTAAQIAAIPHPLDRRFGGTMRLVGYRLETETVEPGGQVAVTLYWQALAPADRDYTVFVHLLGEGDRLVAQRDTYPGLGRLSTARLTAWLEPRSVWADRYVLRVPETAYAPDQLQVEVGMYDAVGGARLAIEGGGDNVRFGSVPLRARPGEVPNPISVNFGERMALMGYDLDRLVARPGETITLTLYWRGVRRMERNYTISAQLVDDGQRKAAQDDGWPLRGNAPTAAWTPGQVVEDAKTLVVFQDALPGLYDVRIAVYVQEEGAFIHLPVISARGEMLADYVVLTRVRVMP